MSLLCTESTPLVAAGNGCGASAFSRFHGSPMAPNDPHPASAITSVTGSTILNAIDRSF
jgi:hypothetical protein